MKDTPILFSAPMVIAILEDRKFQTRRVLKVQPLDILPMLVPNLWVGHIQPDPPKGIVFHCRYGSPGDHLWLRETWAVEKKYDHLAPSKLPKRARAKISYRAEGLKPAWSGRVGRWRPSIHMPRWASRINLEIVKVRVERVQEITEQDALAEGMPEWVKKVKWKSFDAPREQESEYVKPRQWFNTIWDNLNKNRGFGWDTNPYVWRLEFRRIT